VKRNWIKFGVGFLPVILGGFTPKKNPIEMADIQLQLTTYLPTLKG